MNDKVEIHFLGGAGTVTGSKTLIQYGEFRVLIDCGLFQGLKELRVLNRADFPVDERAIDAVILTHAHLDHCGYLPVIVKHGFKGPIHCTHPTRELTEIILMDSAKIQEEDAERANRHSYTKHKKALPLYTQKEAAKSMENFVTHDYEEWVILSPDIKFCLHNAGHILGAAIVELKVAGRRFVFSGDIGRKDPMLMYPPKKIDETDYLIMESTYGDRTHPVQDEKTELCRIVNETFDRHGILMIPSFAVERTQEVIYLLHRLREEGKIPNIPVYLDSPMGIRSTNVFTRYPEWQDVPKADLSVMYESVQFILDGEQSRAIVADRRPKIDIAGSGMLEGGRILHYLNNHGANEKNTLLFVGYQAEGTRGRSIVHGGREIKFFGEFHWLNCQVESISSMSGHGDSEEIIGWMSHLKKAPKLVFLNHGEPNQTNALRVLIETKLGFKVEVPTLNEVYYLD